MQAPTTTFKPVMSSEDFRVMGKRMVDYICDYLDTIEQRSVIPDVEPGYLRPLMPSAAPEQPEHWDDIFRDIEALIMPGITHWQHPRFHAYFPAGNSFPSIMADMLSDALGTIGFSWAASPAMAELEMMMTDWCAQMIGLPRQFTHEATGGGSLQGSASDCILLSMLAARYQAIERHRDSFDEHTFPETAVLSRLVAYCSNLAHSSVEKAGMIAFVQMRQLDIDDDFSMRPEALEEAIQMDLEQGFIPFYVCATIGTTACTSVDSLKKIGPIAKKYGLWMHVDGAYGLNSCICDEFRHLIEGVELADSVNFNPNKWMLVNFDISVLWVADKDVMTRSMVVNPVYLQHKFSSKAIDFRNWGIPLSRRFRALKIWFVVRAYGLTGIRAYIRNHVRLAKMFEGLVRTDARFEIVGPVHMGLVCFRIKGSNALTQCLIRTINESRELHVVPAMVNELYIIRFAVCKETACDEDIQHAWRIIRDFSEEIITAEASLRQWRQHTRENSVRTKRRAIAAASALKLGEASKKADLAQVAEETEDSDEGSNLSQPGELSHMDDSAIMELATERLVDLKELGARDAYNVLAQQLRNLGVNEVQSYEECPTTPKIEDEQKEPKEATKEEHCFNEAVSSTPRVSNPAAPKVSSNSTPRLSSNSTIGSGAARRFSSQDMSHSSSTPVVARLVSMVMNASGNAKKNLNSRRTSQIENSLNLNNTEDLKADVPRKAASSWLSQWRVEGANEGDDDVFMCEDDLGLGSFSKENTLTRLRRQTLLKMISDPISDKVAKRNFRLLRDSRRMTTTFANDCSRPKSEYSRRPTVQMCENIDQELLNGLKRRNKSMIETTSSENKILEETDE